MTDSTTYWWDVALDSSTQGIPRINSDDTPTINPPDEEKSYRSSMEHQA